MRSRPSAVTLAALVALLVSAPVALHTHATAQDAQSADPNAGGLMGGDYLRVSGGVVSPINASGSFRDWKPGPGFALMWENWDSGANGVGRLGFAIGATYAALPLNESEFLSSFRTLLGDQAVSAHSSAASLISIETDFRYRIPMPFIMPSIVFGLGYVDLHPATVHYATATTTGTTSQQRKYGGQLSIGGALDRQFIDRVAIFGEALYTYGFTSLGGSIATPTGTCSRENCDVLKNIATGTIRGGLRVRFGR